MVITFNILNKKTNNTCFSNVKRRKYILCSICTLLLLTSTPSCTPVRLKAVKDIFETLLVPAEGLCQGAELLQRAEAQDVLPGPVRQPVVRRVVQDFGRHPSGQQVAPLRLTQKHTRLGKPVWIFFQHGPPDIHHVDFVLVHHDASAQQEGEHELVLLKQAAAHVAVQAEGEVLVDVLNPLLHRVWKTPERGGERKWRLV